MMQVYEANATRAALPFDRLIAALRERFAGGCEVPARHVHEITSPAGEGGGDLASRRMTSLIMPAWLPGKYYGVKIVNIVPGNAKRGLPGLHSSYLLFDARTGVPLAQIDGDEITQRRTAAASALAASYLARTDAKHLLVVGAGRVAQLLPAAYRAVRPIERVTVWARRPGEAQAMAAQVREAGLPAFASTDLAAACGEADDACFEGARLFVDTDEALQKSGDLLVPMQHGVLRADDVRGTLTTLAKGVATGRKNEQERTVFKSVGTALEDLAAAVLVYESSRD